MKKNIILISVVIVIKSFFITILRADSIPVIVISAGKTAQSFNTVGSSIEIINEEIIKNSNSFSLAEIIEENSTSSNLFTTGGIGSNTGIQLRGLEKRYSAVFIDGVKMMDPSSSDGSFYLENILSNGIEKIEILKGTQSSLYGSNAIGGTINIFTKKGKKNKNPEFKIEFESNNTKNLLYSISDRGKKLGYFLGFNKFTTDGISAMNDNAEPDPYRNDNIVGNIDYQINDSFSFENSFRLADTFYEYDEVLQGRTDLNNSTDNLEFSNSLKLIHKNNNFKNSLSFNKLIIERYTTAYDLSKVNYFGYRDNINYTGEYNFNLDNKIVYGIDGEFDAARYQVDFGETDKEHDESIFSQYFDYQTRIFNDFYITFGLRNDDHSTVGSKKSGRISSAYLIDNKTKLTTSFGTGVRFPALYDYAYGFSNIVANGGTLEELQSERGLSFDFGYHSFFEEYNTYLDLTFFKTVQKNPILNNARTGWVQRNATGRNETQGVEISSKWKPLNNKFDLNFNYTFTDSYDANTCSKEELSSFQDNECRINGNKLATAKVRVPRHAVNTKINYNLNEFTVSSLKIKYKGETRDFGNQNNNWSDQILKDYMVFDFNNSIKISNMLNFNFGIKNLFNKKYEDAYQYSSPKRTINFSIKTVY